MPEPVKIPTVYISPQEWEVASTVVRAISRSHAMINADVLSEHKGEPTKVFTFVPTREVYFMVGDKKSRYTQEQFAAMRQRSMQMVADMFLTLGAPNKGKGIQARKAKAREMFRDMMGERMNCDYRVNWLTIN